MRKLQGFVILQSLILVSFFAIGCSSSPKEEPATDTADLAVPEEPAIVHGEMVLIPAGEFISGTNDEKTASPEQKVFLPAYYIDKYEVTMGEFLKFTVETQYESEGNWRALWAPEKANYPVANITWNDAVAYAKWAGRRLPTEMEWEKAARGPDGLRYPWGSDWNSSNANTFESGMRQPVDVGTYAGDVSPYGVHDLLGNVREWTSDYFKRYKNSRARHKDFGNRFRVIRGGDYTIYGGRVNDTQFHLAFRSYYLPNAHFNFGFRCAKDGPAEGAEEKKPSG